MLGKCLLLSTYQLSKLHFKYCVIIVLYQILLELTFPTFVMFLHIMHCCTTKYVWYKSSSDDFYFFIHNLYKKHKSQTFKPNSKCIVWQNINTHRTFPLVFLKMTRQQLEDYGEAINIKHQWKPWLHKGSQSIQ